MMISRFTWIACFLAIWTTNSLALTYTNSFDGWVGNTTYALTWQDSMADPQYFDLTIARPVRATMPGQAVDPNTPVDYYYTFARQIPRNGNRFLDLTLPPELLPGIYVMLMTGVSNVALTPAFTIDAHSLSVAPSSSAFASATTTFGSYIQVTATESGVVTQDGHTISVKPSDVFSSAVVYTTVIVVSGPTKGASSGKIQLIIGLVFGVGGLVTLPIIVWLVLRYRRRPKPSNGDPNWDKYTPYKIENTNSSDVELMEQSETTASEPRRFWAIVDGEKRLITIPQDPHQPQVSNTDPFADPVHDHTSSRPKQLPRLSIPSGTLYAVNASEPPTPPGQIASNPTPPGPSPSNTAPSFGQSHMDEKLSQARNPRPSPNTPRMLTPEEVSSRMFVPGRAVDMGPLGRTHAGDVDENGLLPPDYSQATQPLSRT